MRAIRRIQPRRFPEHKRATAGETDVYFESPGVGALAGAPCVALRRDLDASQATRP
jgi:hypothetical protein